LVDQQVGRLENIELKWQANGPCAVKV
jgi:hypothetical protein